MAVNLTPGAIEKISTGKCKENDLVPVVQLFSIGYQTSSIDDKQWYLVLLSDGSFTWVGAIAYDIFASNKLQKGSIVQLTKYQLLNDGDILIVDLNVIRGKCDVIGDPKRLEHNETPLMEESVPPVSNHDHADPDLNEDDVDDNHLQNNAFGTISLFSFPSLCNFISSRAGSKTPKSNDHISQSIFHPIITMAANLTPGAITKISSGKCSPTDIKPVIQVLNIHKLSDIKPVNLSDGEKKERYFVELSDGLSSVGGMIAAHLNDLVTSNQLQKGSVVQLNEFVCTTLRGRSIVVVIEVHAILTKCDIIGDPKPYSHKNTSSIEKPTPLVDTGLSNPKEDHADVDPKQPLTSQCSQTHSTKRKRQSGNQKILAAAKDIPKTARMMMGKNKDDMGACFEKLENIGWGTEDPLYDTALLLFGESVDYRKLWLLLKPESCGKWVKNAGSKFGLLG